ncbi:MAG: dTDP-4-dehydrorhamnose reductase family protein [Ignavibacteriales bacterium]
MSSAKKVLILGATGMLGHTIFDELSKKPDLEVYGTVRDATNMEKYFSHELMENIRDKVDINNFDLVIRTITEVKPDIVINCIGIIKQLPEAKDPINCITINALFPHRVAMICNTVGARMIHISTDCVFSGKKGNYMESDLPDADDLYGRTKLLGEVNNYNHCITLRTSVIGHEIRGNLSLIEWFMRQEGKTRGYTNAIFSGFPTVELARIIADYVIPNEDLSGLYHVSAEPISKYDLLKLVSEKYDKKIEFEKFEDFYSDKSLNSNLFRNAAGYLPPSWPDMIEKMHENYNSSICFKKFKEVPNS